MSECLRNFKNITDKELQKQIEAFTFRSVTSNLCDIKQEIDLVIDFVRSKESSYNEKLRFGVPIFLSVALFHYPCSISDFLIRKDTDSDILLPLINGILDYQTCFDNVTLFKNAKILDINYSKLDLFFKLFLNILEKDFKPHYQLVLITKKAWGIFEKASAANLYTADLNAVKIIVLFFVPFLDSDIAGLSNLISNLFEMIIKWSLNNEKFSPTASEIVNLFSVQILDRFYPLLEANEKSSYPLCKINLRFLKVAVHGFGTDRIVASLPMLFEYLLQTISVNYTASISGDIFGAVLKTSFKNENLQIFLNLIEKFMIGDFSQLWFDTGFHELQSLNFSLYVLPNCVKHCLDEMQNINKKILEKLNELGDHRILMWLSTLNLIYPECKKLGEKQFNWLKICLEHNSDNIRIIAYKFICDNYSNKIDSCSEWNLSLVLDTLVNNLTSDNPAFRNHMMSATKRLFVSIRDSVVSHLSDKIGLMRELTFAFDTLNYLYKEDLLSLESIYWHREMLHLDSLLYRDITLFIVFCRFIYSKQWFSSALNYQRQRSLIDLITVIRDVLIDSNFIIDKKCGFSKKTVFDLREFYREINEKYISNSPDFISIFINAIILSKQDVQNCLYTLLISSYFDAPEEVQKSVDMGSLWIDTQILCHSNQPTQLNAGSLFCTFLSLCNYKVCSNVATVVDYLVDYLESMVIIDMNSVLDTSLKAPGHGFLLSIDSLLKQRYSSSVLKDDRVPVAAIKIIKLMMEFMGCEDDDLASFQKMSVTMNSIAGKNSVRMNVEYQHILSWTWQVLKNAANILVSWCQAVVEERSSPIFHEIGVILLKVLCNTRHKGTIICVGNCLQAYIQLGEKYKCEKYWLTARKVAIEECIEGAIKGQYSITRRSAGFPLILLSALVGSVSSTYGSILANECLIHLMNLCNEENCKTNDSRYDPPTVHYLNLMKQICQHPSLHPKLQRYYGDVILLTLRHFTSTNWGIRNAALQLFTTMLSRVASATKGPSSCPSFSELFSIYPQLWKPFLNIIFDTFSCDKFFFKNHILIPTLTLLSNLQYSSAKNFPGGINLEEMLCCLWSHLGSPVLTVRKLAAKCIINCLPYSCFSSVTIIQSHTTLIPFLLAATSSVKKALNISFNQQHGELILFQQIVKKCTFTDWDICISMKAFYQYAYFLIQRGCWFLLDSLIAILLTTDISKFDQEKIKIFAYGLLHNLLNSSELKLNVGRTNLLVSLIKLISILNFQSSILTQLINYRHSDVLQHLCSELNKSTAYQSTIAGLLKNNIGILIQSIQFTLNNYQSNYSPYVMHLLCIVIQHYPDISPSTEDDYTTIIEQLNKTLKNTTLSESVVVYCMQILTWIYSSVHVNINELQFHLWMNQLNQLMNFESVDSSRISAAKNFSRIINGCNWSTLLRYQPEHLVVALTFGCFDENKSIRDEYRFILQTIIHPNSHYFVHFRLNHLIKCYKTLSLLMNVSYQQMLINIWKTVICEQKKFLYLIRDNQAKDVLYEPVPSNIYIEYSIILEIIYQQLKNSSLDKINILDLNELHPEDINDDINKNCATSTLSISKKNLNTLLLLEDEI